MDGDRPYDVRFQFTVWTLHALNLVLSIDASEFVLQANIYLWLMPRQKKDIKCSKDQRDVNSETSFIRARSVLDSGVTAEHLPQFIVLRRDMTPYSLLMSICHSLSVLLRDLFST